MIRRSSALALLVACLAACGGSFSAGGTDRITDPLPAACSNGTKDGTETAVDCGGDACPACAAGLACAAAGDCASGVCEGATGGGSQRIAAVAGGSGGTTPAADGRCRAPSCADLVRNGGESDVDCGGDCAPCGSGEACAGDADCASGTCSGSACADPSGAATDVGYLNLGNLVESVVTIATSESDLSPEALEYTYFRIQGNAQVLAELEKAGAGAHASDAFAHALSLGFGVANLDLLTVNLPSPPAYLFFTWRGESYFRSPTAVNGYDAAGCAAAVLGIDAQGFSDWLTLLGQPSFPLAAAGHEAVGRLWRYEGAAIGIAAAGDLPRPPSHATAIGGADATVRLAWTNPLAASFERVRIYRSAAAGALGEAIATTAGADVASYDDSGLDPGGTYFYTLHALDDLGNETANANQVSATPLP